MKTEIKTIIYLGPEGSYAEIATKKLIMEMDLKNFHPVIKSSILKVIESIDNHCGYMGVVPVENSIEGIVRETVDNLAKTSSRVFITREIILPISHCLISKSTDKTAINKVISYHQGIAQCHHYIAKSFLNDIEVITASSTSGAVKQLLDLPENYAAIGSEIAAEIYGLNIIERGINDIKDNFTRFICLNSSIPEPTGNDKTSIAFSTENKPGVLVDILQAFKENNINLSYIESRPSKRVFGEYTFFMDFDGHIQDEKVRQTIEETRLNMHFYRFLGSYPKCQRTQSRNTVLNNYD